MDVPLIELVLEEIEGDLRKGDAEVERMSAEIERLSGEIERMKAETERIRRSRATLEATAASVRPLLNRQEVAISTEQVAELAHKYWAERGYTDGGQEQDWLRAEQELRAMAHTGEVEAEQSVAS
jgi:predicted RNase H-like nuclease (RuvC/YqgF family)